MRASVLKFLNHFKGEEVVGKDNLEAEVAATNESRLKPTNYWRQKEELNTYYV